MDNNYQNKLDLKKIIILILLVVFLGVGIWYLIKNLAFAFVFQVIAAIISIIFVYFSFKKHMGEDILAIPRMISRGAVFITGLLAVVAMGSYFYPRSQNVYSNNDHHAIALEGLETNQSSFILAENSDKALFDNKNLEGSFKLRNISVADSTATLEMDGVGLPVYTLEKTKGLFKTITYCRALEGQDHLHQFGQGENLELYGIDNSLVATLDIEYYKDPFCNYFKLKPRKWHANYILNYRGVDGEMHTDTSGYNSVIIKRYSLASLFPGIDTINGVDFTKIELARTKTTLGNNIKADEAKEYPFFVTYKKDAGLSALRSGNRTTPVGRRTIMDIKLDNSSYLIGLDNSIPQFRLCAETDGLFCVRFRMPQYRYLSTESLKEGEDDNFTFMITSSIIDTAGNVNEQLSENILLYDMFDNVSNVNQMRPIYMSFHRDNTRVPLQVKVLGDNGNDITVKAGEAMPRIATQNGDARWIVNLDNFKDPSIQRPIGVENPFSANKMIIFIIVITFIFCGLLLMSNDEMSNFIEPIAYIAIITLMAIRLMMLWRASVFPPAMDITLEEFNGWRTASGVMKWCVRCMVFFCVGIFAFKLIFKMRDNNGNYYNPEFKHRSDFDSNKILHLIFPLNKGKNIRICVFLAIWIIIGVVGTIFRLRPWYCVGLTVVYYFFVDYFINRHYGSKVSDRENDSYSYFWLSIVNCFAASFAMFLCDGGYGLLFFVFSLLTIGLKLLNLYGTSFIKNNGSSIKFFGVLLFLIIICCFLGFLRPIVTFIYIGGSNAVVAVVFAIAIISSILAWTLGGFKKFAKTSIVTIIILSVASCGATILIQNFTGDHLANRVKVLQFKPDEVLGQASSAKDMKKFLEASLNDWVLEEYEERGHEMKPFIGENGEGYFKLQPHSKVGVSWMTQLSDLSVPRFMIAEQSSALPILIVSLFALLFLVSLLLPVDRRCTRSLLVQIPLLLTVQSLIVWMAVTRRFVFIGQDFPMISIISTINLCMCFIGFLCWVCIALLEQAFLQKTDKYKLAAGLTDDIQYKNQRRAGKLGFLFPFTAGVLIVLYGMVVGKQKENIYDVKECTDAAYNLIADPDNNSVEALFREYQDSLISTTNPRVYDITKLGNHATIIKSFCSQNGYVANQIGGTSVIDRIFECDPTYGPFAKAAFDHYLKKQIEHNDVENLVYVVKRRYTEEDRTNIENVRYTFDVNTRFYKQTLPTRLEYSWRGSVISRATINDDIPTMKQEGGVRIYTFPAGWTRKPSLIVRPSTSRMSVVGKYEPRHLKSGEAYNLTDGETLYGRGVPDLAKYGSGNYIAKNVIINSRAEFIYPMQKYLYWANPISQQLRGYMNAQLADNKHSKDDMDKPIELTISTTLTKKIFREIDNNGKTNANVAVVVADGDGYVRALVDHKKKEYTINPNDYRRIQQVEDSLRREGMLNRGHEAERFFGNKAILSLDNGPGSSQKPIVWTAVTSQYSGWEWNNLEMARINNNLMPHDGKYKAWSWAGQRIDPRKNVDEKKRGMFRSITNDEGGGNSNVNVRAYIGKSSNYYNAIMAHIGSFTRQELETGTPSSNTLFKKSSALWTNRADHKEAYKDSIFPLLIYDGQFFIFSHPLDNQHTSEQDAILLNGLRDNFLLPTEYNKKDTGAQNKFHPFLSGKVRNNYAYPEKSYFNNKVRSGRPYEVAREGVKMTAIGKNSVWLVSPLSMAEMFGKLISFNRNYRLTIDCNSPVPPYAEFITDGSAEKYLSMRNQQFIPGLSDVFRSGEGTAHGVFAKISDNLGGYYIYGKTGTIDKGKKNEKTDKLVPEDHLLAVVITDRDITEISDPKDFANLKFYVIYIADFNRNNDGLLWVDNDAKIINAVLQSEEFKQYMKGGLK